MRSKYLPAINEETTTVFRSLDCGGERGDECFRSVADRRGYAVDRLADAGAAAVVQRHQGHAPGGVSRKAMGGHVGGDITAVGDVGSLPEWRIGAAGVVVVTTVGFGAAFSADAIAAVITQSAFTWA